MRKILLAAFAVCALGVFVRMVIQSAAASTPGNARQAPKWRTEAREDQLHGISETVVSLDGIYLIAPRIQLPGFRPALVLKCSKGKILENYISFGAVLDSHSERMFPVVMESNIDGKKGTIGADAVSTDGTAAYFPRSELRGILRGHKVIVGADEYVGPEITIEFDVPGIDPVMQACGRDRMLRDF